MRKLIFILVLIISFKGTTSPVCKTTHQSFVAAESWERKEVCMDPYSVICENDNGHENYKRRSADLIEEISDRVGQRVYERNKMVLNRFGVDHIDNINFDDIFNFHQGRCLDDNINECHSKQTLFDPQDPPAWFQEDIIDDIKKEFVQELNAETDKRLDQLHYVFESVKSDLIGLIAKELKGKVSDEIIEEAQYKLQLTKAVFSGSNKSLSRTFPFLKEHERRAIKDTFEHACYTGMDSEHSAFYSQFKFKKLMYDITFYCPADYLGGMNHADNVRSAFNSMALIISHELGHQISLLLKQHSVFQKFDQCMAKYFEPSKIKSTPAHYDDEGQADFWAKRYVGKALRGMSDEPMEEKIRFLKESSVILCTSPDDHVHHSGRMRINRMLRLTRDFITAFSCSQDAWDMGVKVPVDCGIDGDQWVMIPEL